MPETDIFGGVDMDRIVAGAMPQPLVNVPKVKEDLTNIAAEESKAKAPVLDRMVDLTRHGQAEVHDKYEGIEPFDVKPWDAKKAKDEFSTPPMEQFGSWGVLAATLASAFTRQPMSNSLNAAGAAMQAIQARDDVNYERAYSAWKDNTTLAIKRHDMQRQAYDDAIKLMGVDRSAGTAELEALATKFGDKRTSALLQGGYIKELIDYQNTMSQAYRGMLPVVKQMEDWHLKRRLLELDPDWASEDPARKQNALRRVTEGRLDPQQQIYDQYLRENPDAKAEARAEFYKNLRQMKPQSPAQVALQTYIQEGEAAGTPRTSDEIKKFMDGLPGVKGPSAPSPNRSAENKAVDEMVAKAKERGEELTYADALKKVRNETSALPEKEKNVIRTQIDQFDNSLEKIGAAQSVLERHVGASGLAGRATRLAERVGNVLGSNATDRDQFMRDIQYLRLAAGRLLTESRGRPLAAEASRINDIIGGLDAGDTTANTLRALDEVNTLYTKMRADNLSRLRGTWKPSEERGTSAPPPASGGSAPWLNDPVVK